jgi:predicted ATPase/class 3 adenylate cyclase
VLEGLGLCQAVRVGVPSGTVTFLFTDIEGSTRLWDEHPDAMRVALARHDELLRAAIDAHGGFVFSSAGDGFAAAFQRSSDAVAAAVQSQIALGDQDWPEGAGLGVRMGLHSGEAEERDGNYFGPPVNRAARLMAVARGGQILISEVTAALVGTVPGIGVFDLGVHRLRGVVEPTRVFGVKADGLDWHDVPLATAEGTRGNLPHPVTEWFGPSALLNRKAAELGRRRLVTFTGPGGVGKTRLAVEVASLVAADFPDGVWVVELGPLADPDAVLATVASTLGVLLQEGVGLADAIVEWLRGRRLLLILDNCEHVIRPVAGLLGAVVEDCPTVTVIATSREPLGVEGERVAMVPSLDEPDAVELFCDRASALDDTVEFSPADREAIKSICARLDGIPLALELAAAWTRSLSVMELLDRLADRFRLLRGGGRAVERHQTLRAAVEWSYRLLSDTERLLFDRLSVFAGGFDMAGAEAVGGGDGIDVSDVVDLLAGLVDKSLIVVERGGRTNRYRLLETLRQYGEERLGERGDTVTLRRRHLAYYLQVAQEASAMWASARMVEGAASFDREWGNIRAAHTSALNLDDLPGAMSLLEATGNYAHYDLRAEYADWAETTIVRTETSGCAPAWLYGYAAWAPGESSERGFDRSIDLATRGLAAAGDDQLGAALCWGVLGIAYLFTGGIDQVRTVIPALEAAVAATTDPVTVVTCCRALASMASVTDPAAIEAQVRRARAAARQTGSPGLLAQCDYLEGMRLRIAEPRDLDAALACHRRSLDLSGQANMRNFVGLNLLAMGGITVQLGLGSAHQTLAEGIAYLHDVRYWSTLWTLAGYAAAHLSRFARAYEAAVIWGYLQAKEPSTLRILERSLTFPGLDLNGTHAEHGLQAGAAMSRDQIVVYTLGALSAGEGDQTRNS